MRTPIHVPGGPVLPEGTEIKLRLAAPVKIKEAKPGDSVPFVLYHDVYYRNFLLARAGSPVQAHVIDATKARWASRGSKLSVEIDGLQLLNGQTIPMRGFTGTAGGQGRVSGAADNVTNDISLLEDAALILLLTPGSNRDLKEDTSANAYADANVLLDLPSLAPFQAANVPRPARVRIVRGHYGLYYNRDLYCNGIPLAHLNAGHKLELELIPGYYRFAINPKKPFVEIYVSSGVDINLITTYDAISVMNENDTDLNSAGVNMNPFKKGKSAGLLMEHAKPVAQSDVYTKGCSPLQEQFD